MNDQCNLFVRCQKLNRLRLNNDFPKDPKDTSGNDPENKENFFSCKQFCDLQKKLKKRSDFNEFKEMCLALELIIVMICLLSFDVCPGSIQTISK
ncbi:hypothetical protein BpHYR1_050823 [Brachionus plicatilis]|uniref:Uncharacterized protein n=1 Tax=Brachionus plicatilis TaxID=10195 RepID=A0A3M7T7R4_BRAPC|nr:hypothetical protein BpHYR1_050823 [Brachionus plicatilis]